MECEEARKSLIRAVLGQSVAPDDRQQIDRHMETCTLCHARIAELAGQLEMEPKGIDAGWQDQLQAYAEAQLARVEDATEFQDVKRHLDSCIDCSEAYALLYETLWAEQQGTMSEPNHVPAPNVAFLSSEHRPGTLTTRKLISRLRKALPRTGFLRELPVVRLYNTLSTGQMVLAAGSVGILGTVAVAAALLLLPSFSGGGPIASSMPALTPSTAPQRTSPLEVTTAAPTSSSAPSSTGGTSVGGTPVTVSLQDPGGSGSYKFDSNALTFSVGETVSFTFNAESEFHTFTVEGLEIDVSVDGGSSETLNFTFDKPGEYKLICIPHEALGMVGTITVQ